MRKTMVLLFMLPALAFADTTPTLVQKKLADAEAAYAKNSEVLKRAVETEAVLRGVIIGLRDVNTTETTTAK